MGMADPMTTVWRTLCCGSYVGRNQFETDLSGIWEGNHLVTMKQCPNKYCPTNKENSEKK